MFENWKSLGRPNLFPVVLLIAIGGILAVILTIVCRDSGYFDDTILMVAISRTLPQDALNALSGMLGATGDAYSPLLVGIPWLLDSFNILGNASLVLVANVALLAFTLTLYGLLRIAGSRPWAAFTWALAAMLSPVLVDQRLWYVAIQHTFTVTLLMGLCIASVRIVQKVQAGESRNRKLLFQFALLDLLAMATSFGREIILLAAVLAVTLLFAVVGSRRLALATGLAWCIPIPFVLRALATGRAGTQVGSISGLSEIQDLVPAPVVHVIDTHPVSVAVVTFVLILGMQWLLVIGNRRTQTSPEALQASEQPQLLMPRPVVRFALLLGAYAILSAPRNIAVIVADIPGMNVFVHYQESFAGRWATFTVQPSVWLLVAVLLFTMAILGPLTIEQVALCFSLALVTPYMAGNFVSNSLFGGETGLPLQSLSRYAIYLLPAVILVCAQASRSIFEIVRVKGHGAHLNRSLAPIASGLLITAVVVASIGTIEYRVKDTQSITYLETGDSVVPCVAAKTASYLTGYAGTPPGEFLADTAGIFRDRFRLQGYEITNLCSEFKFQTG